MAVALLAPAVLSLCRNGGRVRSPGCWPVSCRCSYCPSRLRSAAEPCCPASRDGSPPTARFRSTSGSCRWRSSSAARRPSSSTCTMRRQPRAVAGRCGARDLSRAVQDRPRAIGRRYGDPAAGGQSLGQKNTVLAVWMAQSFLDPISSVAPTAYIVFQNFVNSYQIWRKDREQAENRYEPPVPCGCGERNRSVQRACGVFREALRPGRSCVRERSGAGKAGDGRRDGSRRRCERRKRRRENGDAAGEGQENRRGFRPENLKNSRNFVYL